MVKKFVPLFIIPCMIVLCSSSTADAWKTYYTNAQVQVLYKYQDCNDKANGIFQEKILLKFVNLTNQKIELSFSEDVFYAGSKPVETDNKVYKVIIEANSEVSGTCTTKDEGLFIFSKHLDFAGTELKKFELKNFNVKTIQ